eukprot:7460444-Pyramimonas_sp.AAC.1
MTVVDVEELRCKDRPAEDHESICFTLTTAGIECAPVVSDQGKLPAGLPRRATAPSSARSRGDGDQRARHRREQRHVGEAAPLERGP